MSSIPCKIDPLGACFELPFGYTRVAYLECTGEQSIELGVSFSPSTSWRGVIVPLNSDSVSTFCSSGNLSFLAPYRGILRFLMYRHSYFPLADGTYATSWSEAQNKAYYNIANKTICFTLNKKGNGEFGVIWKDNEVSRSLPEPLQNNQGTILFAQSTGYNKFVGRMYRFTITEGEIIKGDYLPIIDSIGKPCIWDKVSKQPLYNLDDKGFIVGVQSQHQLDMLLHCLPDLTGGDIGTLQMRLAEELKTPENLAALDDMLEKNWEITQAV